MEPPEVEDNAYRVFDARGHEAVLAVPRWDVELVSWAPSAREGELRTVLLTFVSKNNVDVDAQASLDEVVRKAEQLAYRLQCDRLRPRIVWTIAKRLRRTR